MTQPPIKVNGVMFYPVAIPQDIMHKCDDCHGHPKLDVQLGRDRVCSTLHANSGYGCVGIIWKSDFRATVIWMANKAQK